MARLASPPTPEPIAFLAKEPGDWQQRLRAALPQETIIDLAEMTVPQRQQARFAIVANPEVDALNHLPNLQWIHSLWAGVDSLVAFARDQQLSLTRLLDPGLANAMAEAVLAWSLYLSRYMPEYQQKQRDRHWQEQPYRPAADWQVGVLGLGQLGLAACKRLRDNGFSVSAWRRRVQQLDVPANVSVFHGPSGLDQLLAQSDIVVCLLPLTQATRALLNAEKLALFSPTASIINFARSPILPTDDLIDALRMGNLRHAVLDVFDEEPLPRSSELWGMPNATILPHCSAPTPPASAIKRVVENLAHYRNTGEIRDLVDLAQGY